MNIIDQQVASVHKKIGGHIIMIGETVILRPQGKYDGPMGVIGLYSPELPRKTKFPSLSTMNSDRYSEPSITSHGRICAPGEGLIEKYAVDDISFHRCGRLR